MHIGKGRAWSAPRLPCSVHVTVTRQVTLDEAVSRLCCAGAILPLVDLLPAHSLVGCRNALNEMVLHAKVTCSGVVQAAGRWPLLWLMPSNEAY